MAIRVVRQRRLERGVLRRRADVAEIFRLADKFQFRRTAVGAIGGNGDGRQIVFSVRQRKTEAERAVGTQFDFMATERDFRARFRGAVDNQLRIDVEPKAFRLVRARATGRAGGAGGNRQAGRAECRHRRGRVTFTRKAAADELGDFKRAHPDAAGLVNADDLASAFSCSGVHRRVGPGAMTGE